MKKSLITIAILLTILLSGFPVYATTSNVENPNTLPAEAEALTALFEQITTDMTEAEIQALLSELNKNQSPVKQEGEIVGDTYFNPIGFSFKIPDGYQVLQDQFGATVHMVSPFSKSGFAPTIQVLVYGESLPDFENLTQKKVDTYFGSLLLNYQFVSLDHYIYNNVTAHEFICLHGASEDDMMVQHSLCFNKGDKAYILTMTTLAEEATLQHALNAFDTFLEGFDASDANSQNQGNG